MKNSNNFAIVIDSSENVPCLLETIKELEFVERHCQQQVDPLLLALGRVLVFNKKPRYDYQIEESNSAILDWLEDIFGKKTYKVSNDLDNIVEELYRFAGKEKKSKKDMTINITISTPKVAKPKRKVRVFTNFVKVGWDQYSIKIDPYTGYEYVLIKGNRYEVVRDVLGKGYLVEI
jgi:hypothetical protein